MPKRTNRIAAALLCVGASLACGACQPFRSPDGARLERPGTDSGLDAVITLGEVNLPGGAMSWRLSGVPTDQYSVVATTVDGRSPLDEVKFGEVRVTVSIVDDLGRSTASVDGVLSQVASGLDDARQLRFEMPDFELEDNRVYVVSVRTTGATPPRIKLRWQLVSLRCTFVL